MLENYVSKKRYVKKMLDKFERSNSKVVSTLLANHFKLSLDYYPKTETKVEYISKVHYASDVVLLVYVMDL